MYALKLINVIVDQKKFQAVQLLTKQMWDFKKNKGNQLVKIEMKLENITDCPILN